MAALFSKAAKAGLDADYIREELAPAVIGKRLSEAGNREIFRVVEHLAGLYNPPPSPFEKGGSKKKRFDSSRRGLLLELEDAARSRWGAEFEEPLNRLVNHNRRAPTHYRFLRVTEIKAFMGRIREMNERDGRANG